MGNWSELLWCERLIVNVKVLNCFKILLDLLVFGVSNIDLNECDLKYWIYFLFVCRWCIVILIGIWDFLDGNLFIKVVIFEMRVFLCFMCVLFC